MSFATNYVPRAKTTSDQFGKAFSNLAGGVTQHLVNREQSRQRQAELMQENEAIKKDVGIDLSGINDPEARKQMVIDALQGRREIQKQGFESQSQNQKQTHERELQELKDFNSLQNQSSLATQKHEQELIQEEARSKGKKTPEVLKNEEHQQVKATAQNSFNTMVNLLKKKNIGLGSGVLGNVFGGETAEDTGEFLSASGGLEAMLVDMVSRGALSNARFEYITNTLLPKPTDRQKVIKGKLKGLAQILGLDPGALNSKESSEMGSEPTLEDIWK